MRTGNLGSSLYAPGQVPADPKALPAFLSDELRKLQAALALLALGHVDRTHVEPLKPRDGDVRLFDGTDFDPGSGRGLYYYDDSVPGWVFVA